MIQSGDPTGTGFPTTADSPIRDEYLPGLRVRRLAADSPLANTGKPGYGGAASSSLRPMPWRAHGTASNTILSVVVVEGQDVVEQINRGPVHDDRPVQPVKLLTVTIERVGPETGLRRGRSKNA